MGQFIWTYLSLSASISTSETVSDETSLWHGNELFSINFHKLSRIAYETAYSLHELFDFILSFVIEITYS